MELRHGYTLADLQRVARAATLGTRSMLGDFADRYAEAYGAMVEYLYSTDEPMPEVMLYRAAQDGLHAQAAKDRSYRGIARHEGGGTSEPCTAPRFAIYWSDLHRSTPSPEDRIVERLALQQILPTLAPRQRQAVGALAAFGDYRSAAAALGGIADTAYRQALASGRKRFMALWHEGESPSRIWAADRRTGRGLREAMRDRRAKKARKARITTPEASR